MSLARWRAIRGSASPAAFYAKAGEWALDPNQPSTSKTLKRRRSSTSSSSSQKKMKLPYGDTNPGNINREAGDKTTTAPSSRKTSGNLKKFKKLKVGKPDPAFKKLVHKSLGEEEATGFKVDKEYLYFPQVLTNKQGLSVASSYSLFDIIGPANVGHEYPMFHPYYFLDAASVLFNNKAATVGSYLPTTSGTLGYGQEPGFPASAGFSQTARFTVINSYETWLIKNNTQRTVTIKILLCAVKKPNCSTVSPYDVYTGGYIANGAQDAACGPLNSWNQCLVAENKQLLTADTENTLGLLPTSCRTWSEVWDHDYTQIVLEPGNTYSYHVEGPKDLVVDFSKYTGPNNDKLFDMRTYVRVPLFIYHMDLVGCVGRTDMQRASWGPSSADGTAIGIERTKYVKIACPVNLVGPVVSATNATKPQQIALNRHRYFHFNWGETVIAGNAVEVTEQTEVITNPAK